jgi:hypothetical protein
LELRARIVTIRDGIERVFELVVAANVAIYAAVKLDKPLSSLGAVRALDFQQHPLVIKEPRVEKSLRALIHVMLSNALSIWRRAPS